METVFLKCTAFVCFILIIGVRAQDNICQKRLKEYANTILEDMLSTIGKNISDYVSKSMAKMTASYSYMKLVQNTGGLISELNRTLEENRAQILEGNVNRINLLMKRDNETSLRYKTSMDNYTDAEIKRIQTYAMLLTESMETNLTAKAREASTELYTKTVTKPSSVAFTALLEKDVHLGNDSEYIVFEREIGNIGSGYNKSSGIFTAPVKGVYLISSSFLVKDGYVNVELLKNGKEVARGYGVQETLEGTGLIHILLKLDQADYVGLKMVPQYVTGFIRGDLYSSFVGFLVKS